MFDVNNPGPWLIIVMAAVLAYFLRDAHANIKNNIARIQAEKASQAELDRIANAWREDVKADRDSHQRELARMERHYEEKFDNAINDLHKQISELKTDLKDRMDMILKLLEQRP